MSSGGKESSSSAIPLPVGVDGRWIAKTCIAVLVNQGINDADRLLKKFSTEGCPYSSFAESLIQFMMASMTFEDEILEATIDSLKKTTKMCDKDNSSPFLSRNTGKLGAEDRLSLQIIGADCELLVSMMLFLKQKVLDYIKAGLHLRRAWKIYDKIHSDLKARQAINRSSDASSMKKKPSDLDGLTDVTIESLLQAVSFGFGLVQVALSVVPSEILKVCETIGFSGDRVVGLRSLSVCGRSDDLRAPIALLVLLWYHAVVRPFCGLDGGNGNLAVRDAQDICEYSEKLYGSSPFFQYFKALTARLSGNLNQSLAILDEMSKRAAEQREVALVCYYERGWVFLLKSKWADAYQCFYKLKEISKWSLVYYQYLIAICLGADGKVDEACEAMQTVLKMPNRKTQLELFVIGKVAQFKKSQPTSDIFLLFAAEIIFLWNALPNCEKEDLSRLLTVLQAADVGPYGPLKTLVIAALLSTLGIKDHATKLLTELLAKRKTLVTESHVMPFCLFELASIYLEEDTMKNQGYQMMQKIKDSYKDYGFENRLSFRIHASLFRYKQEASG